MNSNRNAVRATDALMVLSRRSLLKGSMACAAGLLCGPHALAQDPGKPTPATKRRPVIDITDLYHPPQDPGDNVDLIAAYALPEVDLRAVILDVTGRYRRPYVNPTDHSYDDPAGHRDPGFIPVLQLNAIFGKDVPCAVGPFEAMRRPEDPMTDAPAFQQFGVALLLRTLRESAEPVDVVSFGSARPLAVAYNREPRLLEEKVRRVHLCAGGAPPGYLEWNVQLDPHAFVRVLRSNLRVALYPCATDKGPMDVGQHNTYWRLPNLETIRGMAPALRRYLAFALERNARADFLAAMEEDPPEDVVNRIAAQPHNVWETAVWMEVANRKLVRRADGHYRIIPAPEVAPGDTVVSSELRPCTINVHDDGQFDFSLTDQDSRFQIYYRADPQENQRALQEALPALYQRFKP